VLLTKGNWDTLAEGARWSRAHFGTITDTHWINGDQDKLEVYGWAAWSPEAGIVTLRNPSKDVQRYRLNFAHAFELGSGSVTSYKVHGAWSDAIGRRVGPG
jgi:hypothetical protein